SMDTEGITGRSTNLLRHWSNSRQKLFSVEANRIASILENCISQVEIAASLSAVLLSNSMSSAVDEELSKALQEHQLLGERLETLEGEKQESGGEQEAENEEAMKKARAKLEKDIKNSVRDLFRHFRTHPDAIFSLKSVLDVEVRDSECKLITGLKMFYSHMVEKLLTSPDEELQLTLYKQVTSSTANDLDHVVSLEEQVDTAMKQIDSLKNVLTYKPQTKMSKKQASIQQEIDQLKIQLNNLILENRQAERVLQERNEKVENEIEYLLQHFDDKIEENQADLELNEIDNEREEEELRRLEVPFSVLKVEYDQIQEKLRLAEEKRKEEMRVLELQTKAAIFAQAWWRGYSVRKALQNKGKTKKAKKSKGKKK
uniref:Dynein regulatory complex protein 10 n=1 Tax=Anabas testudineus TaxID=64144 RepID=A0A7N6BTR6_ANATE